ncbi:hypothetical protein PVK06_002362 [Gossypium arboreum]|uniref:Aminotransferase-like plant mobile domain-containing protein n=1 Tax=Gossypium arboreum TaxID=29729 RepID=A0ABR0R3J7_GOSAR|nr:hypothetical protein PVK06_002362 [Gossypium arboreum]
MGVSSISRLIAICYNLLGCSPSKGKFTGLRFSWLKDNFEHLLNTASEWKLAVRSVTYVVFELCRMTNPSTVNIDECLILLQSWTLYHMPFLALWYSEMGKPFLFGERLMVVLSHMTQLGQPSHPYPLPHLLRAPEPKAKPELHSGDSSYHPDLGTMTNFWALQATNII